MSDPDHRTGGYNARLSIVGLPLGEATWQFTTRADENGVSFTELVRVVPAKELSPDHG